MNLQDVINELDDLNIRYEALKKKVEMLEKKETKEVLSVGLRIKLKQNPTHWHFESQAYKMTKGMILECYEVQYNKEFPMFLIFKGGRIRRLYIQPDELQAMIKTGVVEVIV